MTHVMDLVFIEGVKGTRRAINLLRDIRDQLQNKNGVNATQLTTKFDGAPAIICGIDPLDGVFFVAKKSAFNKTPIIFKSSGDIAISTMSAELKAMFNILLEELGKLGIKGIIQGDLLYLKSDLGKQTLNGEECVTFHPNTIVYAVPADSDLGKRVKSSEIGITFHTVYNGKDLTQLEASYGKDITSSLRDVKSVWATDAIYKDVTGKANFTVSESDSVNEKLSSIGKLFNSTSSAVLNHMHGSKEILDIALMYINYRIKNNKFIDTPDNLSRQFLEFTHDRFQMELDKKKSVAGKTVNNEKREAALKYLNAVALTDLGRVFELAYKIDEVKNIIVTVLNRASHIGTFFRTAKGFHVTNQEGFVAINTQRGDVVKLVDRMEFSSANFGGTTSDKILRGWETTT